MLRHWQKYENVVVEENIVFSSAILTLTLFYLFLTKVRIGGILVCKFQMALTIHALCGK